jgi:large subunit ribosomal protein L4e
LAHPPESWKVTYKKINKKEKMIALYSSISSTAVNELAKKRGHSIDDIKSFPLVVVNELENIQKTKELLQVLKALGIENDLKRVENSIKKRTGKSRRRGRSNKIGKSAIIIVGTKDSQLLNLNDSIPGITVKYAKNLSVLDFAPGSKPVRLSIFSQSALDVLKEIKLPLNLLLEK